MGRSIIPNVFIHCNIRSSQLCLKGSEGYHVIIDVDVMTNVVDLLVMGFTALRIWSGHATGEETD